MGTSTRTRCDRCHRPASVQPTAVGNLCRRCADRLPKHLHRPRPTQPPPALSLPSRHGQKEAATDEPGRCRSGSVAGRQPAENSPSGGRRARLSVFMIFALVLLRLSVPTDPRVAGSCLTDSGRRAAVQTALNLSPCAGIAFLWFTGL